MTTDSDFTRRAPLANGGTVGGSAAREVTVFAGFTGSTQFIVDVTGYYA